MDNQNIPNTPVTPPPAAPASSDQAMGKSSPFSRKTIFIILGIIILAEVVWAGWSLLSPKEATQTTPSTTSAPKQSATASLVASKNEVSVGEDVIVTLNVSATSYTDGIDLIVNFDPKLLTISTSSGTPVSVGTMFSDYPQNRIDAPGKIVISAITDQTNGVLPNGILGTISFKALIPGQARLSLEFAAGSTIDSNVIETGTGNDILNSVFGVDLRIIP